MQLLGKKRFRRGVAVALAAGGLAVGGHAAYGQTTTTAPAYPGSIPTTTVPPGVQTTTVDLGFRGLGARFTVSQCGYAQSTDVAFNVNGVNVPGDRVDANTCVQETFEIARELVALPAGHRGRMLAATGLAAGTNVLVTVNGQPVKIGPLGSKVTSTATGTAVNGQQRVVTVTFTVLRANAVDGQGNLLARTGSTILEWSPVGAGLVGFGYLLVLAARRRRAIS